MTTKSRKASKQRRAGIASALARSRKPVTMQTASWDHGATGVANRAGLVIEQRGEPDPETGEMVNPNGITGARRVDLLEHWLKIGRISTNGFNAAVKLRDAFEATQRGKPALPDNDRVSSSPKPDHAVAIMVDRISALSAITKHIAPQDREIVLACVADGHHPAKVYGSARWQVGMQHLGAALDRLYAAMERHTK